MQNNVEQVVVAHRDRLCRIAWEHFKWLFEFHGVDLIVEDQQECSPESEFTDDLFSIIHVFSARHCSLRRNYTTQPVKEKEIERDEKKRNDELHKVECE